MGHGEGLNLEINEESVQLSCSMLDRVKERWRKNSSRHWSVWQVVCRHALKYLWETPCADPHAGCCGGWGIKTPGYPIRADLLLTFTTTTALAVITLKCSLLGLATLATTAL